MHAYHVIDIHNHVGALAASGLGTSMADIDA
jgi:hypothetical protein